MATKIRLARRGKKRKPVYDVIIADSRAPRDGKFIEKIGSFNPNVEPPVININTESAFNWVMKGAQPTETTRKLLSIKGVMFRKHLQVGVDKGAITQEEADKKFATWLSDKDAAEAKAGDAAAKAADKAAADASAAREKVRTDAAAAAQKAQEEALAAATAAEAEAAAEAKAEETTEEAPAVEAEATEEAPAADAGEEAKA